MSGLSEAEQEALVEALRYDRCEYGCAETYTRASVEYYLAPAVEAIVTARVTASLNEAAESVDARVNKNIGGHPFSDHDRGLAEARVIIRAQIPQT